MNANELANLIGMCGDGGYNQDAATILRQQQNEIDRLNYDLDGFKQNFFVSGFHLQIKMANEQLLKQQEQIDALKSELDRAVELYTDKAIENEALKAGKIRAYDNGVEDGRKPNTNLVKELTDEEIVDIGTEFLAPKDCDIYTFARAILRKAQEK